MKQRNAKQCNQTLRSSVSTPVLHWAHMSHRVFWPRESVDIVEYLQNNSIPQKPIPNAMAQSWPLIPHPLKGIDMSQNTQKTNQHVRHSLANQHFLSVGGTQLINSIIYDSASPHQPGGYRSWGEMYASGSRFRGPRRTDLPWWVPERKVCQLRKP